MDLRHRSILGDMARPSGSKDYGLEESAVEGQGSCRGGQGMAAAWSHLTRITTSKSVDGSQTVETEPPLQRKIYSHSEQALQ